MVNTGRASRKSPENFSSDNVSGSGMTADNAVAALKAGMTDQDGGSYD